MKSLIIGPALCLVVGTLAVAEPLPTRDGATLWVRIGQTAPVYGMRGAKCDEAPTFKSIRARLPRIELGSFSDGGTTTRDSASCSSGAAVRIINFTGKKAGMSRLSFSGDFFFVRVEAATKQASQ